MVWANFYRVVISTITCCKVIFTVMGTIFHLLIKSEYFFRSQGGFASGEIIPDQHIYL